MECLYHKLHNMNSKFWLPGEGATFIVPSCGDEETMSFSECKSRKQGHASAHDMNTLAQDGDIATCKPTTVVEGSFGQKEPAQRRLLTL